MWQLRLLVFASTHKEAVLRYLTGAGIWELSLQSARGMLPYQS